MIDKRSLILKSTLELLSTRGFHGFSIRDVAKSAGIATGTLYLYFKDRDDLIRQLYESITDEMGAHMMGIELIGKPVKAQFEEIFMRFWTLFEKRPEILVSKSQFDHLPPEVLQGHYQAARKKILPIIEFFEASVAANEIIDLPENILFSLAFAPLIEVARLKLIGIQSNVSNEQLSKIRNACWASLRSDAVSDTNS